MTEKAKGKRRVLKWGLRILVLLLLIGGASAGAFATGRPQEFAVEWTAGVFAGISVDAEGVQLFNRVHIDSLKIFPDNSSRANDEPFAEIENIDLALDLGDARRVTGLTMEYLNLYVSSDDEGGNIEFVESLLASDDSETDVTWLPETIRIDSVWLLYQDEIASAELMGVEFDASIRDNGDIEARMHGVVANGLHTAIQTGDSTLNSSYENLKVDLSVVVASDNITAKGVIEESGQLEARLDAAVDVSGDAPVLQLSELLFDIYQPGWEMLGTIQIGDAYGNAQFSELAVKDVSWVLDGEAYPTATVSAAIRGLDVNDDVGSLFDGDVAVEELQFTGGETLTVQGQVQVNDDLVCLLDAFQGADEQRATIAFEDWPKTSLASATPSDFRGWFEDLAFDTLGGTAGVELRGDEFAVVGDVSSASAQGDSPVGLKVLLNGTRGKVSGTTGELLLSLGEGRASGRGELNADGDYTGTLNVERMPLRPFALLSMGARLPEHVSGVIDGTVTLNQPADSVIATVSPQFKLTQLVFNDKSQPDAGITGDIEVDTESRIAKSNAITLGTPNDELGIVMNEAVYALDSQVFDGRLELFVDLGWFDGIAEAGGLFGTSHTLGAVTGKDGIWEVAFKGTSEDAGYGDLLLPYGSVMTAEGTMRVTESSLLTEFVDTTISVDEGSRIVIPKAEYIDETFTGSATMESDLQILVAMAYLESIEGSVTGDATWTMARDTNIDWSFDGTIGSLKLPENAGTADSVTLAMKGGYTDAFTGSGTISATAITASGATVHETKGTLGFEENNLLVVSNAASRLFEGSLESRVGIGILDEGTPVRYEGKFERINLTRLTEEVQPPKTRLTGFGRGDLEADYSLSNGLQGFTLHAESAGFFTINRSLVEEMMQMQSALKGLGENQLRKTLAKFLGDAPQRPFDSAVMDLFLSEGAIEGVAEMKSKQTDNYNGLNLTVQLSIDKPALAEALKMLESEDDGA